MAETDVKIHKVITYGHPTLRVRCDRVTEFNDELRQFAEEMFATMITNDGVGLAASQVDRAIQLLVLGIPQEDSNELLRMVMINPEVIESSGSWVYEEGCLSLPDIRDDITRAKTVRVRYQDLDGKEHVIEAEGLPARAMLHEIDHLNGIMIVDHLSPVRRALHAGKLKRLVRENRKHLSG